MSRGLILAGIVMRYYSTSETRPADRGVAACPLYSFDFYPNDFFLASYEPIFSIR